MEGVAPRSEQELARALARAVEESAAGGMRDLQATLDRLHDLLFGRGSDGIVDLSVAQSGSTCVTILAFVIWVESQRLGPVEAEFHLDQAKGSVQAFTVRAGDARRDAPVYSSEFSRTWLGEFASRPTADEDWEHVLHYDFD